jgi:tryptophan-rich sensory protein
MIFIFMKKGVGKGLKKISWKFLILSFVVVYAVAFAGGVFTSKGVNSFWYLTVKPSITPPNWVFPVVWNILFFLIAVSLYLVLVHKENKKGKSARLKAEIAFSINLVLNFLWSFLYFYLRNPTLAFFDLILMWLSIAAMIYFSYKISKKTAWLLVPYLLWVAFAGVLNYLSAFK